jgi:hypothetical protein
MSASVEFARLGRSGRRRAGPSGDRPCPRSGARRLECRPAQAVIAIQFLQHCLDKRVQLKRLAADTPFRSISRNSLVTVARQKEEGDASRLQGLCHRVDLRATDVHIEEREVDLNPLRGREGGADRRIWPDDGTQQVVEEVLDEKGDQHLIFDNKNAQTRE